MRVMRGAYFWQFGSIASLPTETTDGEILVAFLGPNMASEAISECQIFKNFPGGHAPRPPYLVHTYAHEMAVPVRNSWRRACERLSHTDTSDSSAC